MTRLRAPRPGSVRHELDARRAEFCRPLTRDLAVDDPFFCDLGTLWCTEGHGDSWETPWYEYEVLRPPRPAVYRRRPAREFLYSVGMLACIPLLWWAMDLGSVLVVIGDGALGVVFWVLAGNEGAKP